MKGKCEDVRGTNIMIQSSVVTETWPRLGRGFLFQVGDSYDSQRGWDFTTGISGQNGPERQ